MGIAEPITACIITFPLFHEEMLLDSTIDELEIYGFRLPTAAYFVAFTTDRDRRLPLPTGRTVLSLSRFATHCTNRRKLLGVKRM